MQCRAWERYDEGQKAGSCFMSIIRLEGESRIIYLLFTCEL
jgi:hypothetical protein